MYTFLRRAAKRHSFTRRLGIVALLALITTAGLPAGVRNRTPLNGWGPLQTSSVKAAEYPGVNVEGLTADQDYETGKLELLFTVESGIATVTAAQTALATLAQQVALIGANPATSVTSIFPIDPNQSDYQLAHSLGMDRGFTITFSPAAPMTELMRAYAAASAIEQVDAVYIPKTTLAPDDPYYTNPPPTQPAWHHQNLHSPAAWNTTTGSPSTVIAVVDAGFDFRHPDFYFANGTTNIWQNLGEDADGDGHTVEWSGSQWVYDPGDVDNIDNDANTYRDDFIGWDFAGNDNDVSGDPHGTAVAGVAGAATNNTLGVAAMCWTCKLMLLKHASSTSIYYAVRKGASVMNFSSGTFSPTFAWQQAIQYAESNNVPIIGGAGNENADTRFYPAAYDQAIAVGGVLQDGTRAGGPNGSTYGAWVDVAAPWTVWTMEPNGAYVYQSGTSMASPMVAGAVGLLKSQRPTLTNAEIRSLVRTSVNAVSSNEYIGTGQLDAEKLVTFGTNVPVAEIDSWFDGKSISHHAVMDITGTATSPAFDRYRVEYGLGAYPTSWTTIYESTTAVPNGTLATLNGALLPSTPLIAVRLTVIDTTGTSTIDQTVLPVGDRDVFRTSAAVKGAVATGDLDLDGRLEVVAGTSNNRLYAWNDDGTLLAGGWPKTLNGFIEGAPALGDLTGDGRPDIIVGTSAGSVYAWGSNGTLLWQKEISGQIRMNSPVVVDLDNNGGLDVLATNTSGSVNVWRADGSPLAGWPQSAGGNVAGTPAVGDVDNDGRLEVVVGTSSNNRLIAWNDSGSQALLLTLNGPVTSSPVVANLDSYLGSEIVFATGGTDLKVYAVNGNGTSVYQNWPQSIGGSPRSSPAIGDVDMDGLLDIVIGTTDKKVYAWTVQTGFALTNWPVTLNRDIDASSPAIADIDGDDRHEVLIGTLNINGALESYLYALNDNGSIASGWPKATANAINSSPSVADLDADGTIEVSIGSGADTLSGGGDSVYVWWMNTPSSIGRNVWPTFHRDVNRSGEYGRSCGIILNHQCTSTQPQRCTGGALVPVCGICGCPVNEPVCFASGYCSPNGGGGGQCQSNCELE